MITQPKVSTIGPLLFAMGKKSKAVKASASNGGKVASKGAVVDEKKLKQKMSEIDDLFASAKETKKRQLEEAKEEEKTKSSSNKSNKKKQKVDKNDSSSEDEDDDEEGDEDEDFEEDVEETGLPYGVIKSGIKDKRYSIPMSIISPDAPLERIDKETGLPVYKAHLLKVGEGGGTALCPFDCDCCF